MFRKICLGVAITGGAILLGGGLPMLAGFGAIGIKASSIAAGIQAGIGNVVAGSWFAIMTSLGMTGVFATTAAVGAIIGGGGLTGYLALEFSARRDAQLIHAVIQNHDEPNIIMGIIQDRIEEQLVNIIESYHNQFGGNMEEDILGYVPENEREQYRVALHRFERNE